MTEWDEAVTAYLPPDTVLGQIEAAVVVTDKQSNLLYANGYASRLFDFPDIPERLVGRSLLSLRRCGVVPARGTASSSSAAGRPGAAASRNGTGSGCSSESGSAWHGRWNLAS